MENWMAGLVIYSLFKLIFQTARGPVEVEKPSQGIFAFAVAFAWMAGAPPMVWWLAKYWGWI